MVLPHSHGEDETPDRAKTKHSVDGCCLDCHGGFHLQKVRILPGPRQAFIMVLSNPWFLLALVATLGLFHLELLATILNMSALKPMPPPRFRATISDEVHERTLEYAR